jgi:hypothetical protein
MSTDNREPKKLRVRFLRDAIADKRHFLEGQEALIDANEARYLAINGLPGGAGGAVCIGPSPSVQILE